jgi:hypothetical protein
VSRLRKLHRGLRRRCNHCDGNLIIRLLESMSRRKVSEHNHLFAGLGYLLEI